MPAKKKRRKNKKIVINKYKIWIPLILISIAFFFSKTMAEGSPLFLILALPSYFLFWEYWSIFFFWVLFALWAYILINETVLKSWIFKKISLLIILATWIISFPILDWWWSAWIDTSKWWWLWYIAIWWVSFLLWWQVFAIQVFFIALFLLTIAWILYSLKIKIKAPKFQLDIKEKKEIKKEVKSKVKNDKDKKTTENKWLFFNKGNKEENNNKSVENWNSAEKDTLKTLLKQKVQDKYNDNSHKKDVVKQKITFPEDKPSFDINVLQKSKDPWKYEIDDSFLMEKASAIRNKLEEFWIPVSIEWYNIWPTVIQIKIKPEAWIKISKIENLKKDLSLWLKTKSLRVLAPIPWTEFVWIEIANPKPQVVTLNETLGSSEFGSQISKSLTNLSLWKWIDWNISIKALEKMPHLLVAWATWSGKSVWINDFILSLIYQNNPSELKFIMVDPKQVELGMYEWIPYLLSPIITEPEKAVKVLKRAVEFMNNRYQKLKKLKVRNIDQYNKKVEKEEKMYRLVIIIDELADLMMSWSKKDTENYIARIAQMARAVWIHLIVATQRPSVNVITWVIKANIPTRIAFGVVSVVDSRTILDSKWAEDLVWRWDMLYMDTSTKFPIRLQAPFVDTDETEDVVSKIKEKYMKWLKEEEIYHPEIINILESKPETWDSWWSWDDDELVEQAIQIIAETRKASATMLQRKLWVWFARAARIMDILEERWVVWPADWAKPREIFV